MFLIINIFVFIIKLMFLFFEIYMKIGDWG